MMQSRKVGDILKFLNLLVLMILFNLIAANNFFRMDLTEEKRFSISPATKEILSSLDDNVLVEVYLEGQLPSGFERMKRAVQETLEEFRVYSKNKISYRFIDPELGGNAQAKQSLFQRISEKGILPYDVFLTENGNRVQKRVLPGAVVSYGIAEQGVQLFKGNQAAPSDIRLNQSIEGIEYELASAIKTISEGSSPTISFVTGHGELDSLQIASFKSTLASRYRIRRLNLAGIEKITNTDVLIIPKPTSRFSDQDKYKVDQYIMNGGKALFLLDMLNVNLDSVQEGTFAFGYDHNLQDLLFKYGVRLNQDLVQDIISGRQPIVIGAAGEEPQIQLLPWPYNPILNNFSTHVITRNLDAIYGRIAGSIDTVKAIGVKKTPLVFTSNYSRRLAAPVRIFADDLKTPLTQDKMNEQNIPLAILLEGTFTSLYNNRFAPKGIDRSSPVIGESRPTSIIVMSDGDFIRNEINPNNNRPMELGYEPYSRQMFGNMDFLLNSVDYLVDGQGLITARAKEIRIRPLDTFKLNNEKTYWQTLNLAAPLMLILIFGFVRFFLRKRKYARY